jgi:glycosyltransferase involved in cell wall biosynthesis
MDSCLRRNDNKVACFMRIAAFGRSLPVHNLGGLEVHFLTMVEGLAARGHEVEVFTTRRRDGVRGERRRNLTIHYLPRTLPGRYELGYFSRSASGFIDVHRRDPFDAILSESSAVCGVLRRYRHLPKDVPAVWMAHGTWKGEIETKLRVGRWRPKQLVGVVLCLNHWRRDREYIQKCQVVIACGEGLREELIEVYGLDPTRVVFQSNGVDTDLFAPDAARRERFRMELGINSDVPLLMLSSRLHPEKGIGKFLDLMPELVKGVPGLRCIIVGEGPERQELERKVASNQLQDEVRFLGVRPRVDLPGLYNASDVFVFPSQRSEGQPMSLIEAMASGLPVIATKVGWMVSLFEDGVTGILVEPGDSQVLGKGVLSLLKDPRKRALIGKAGREKAVEVYSIDRAVGEVESILQRLVAEVSDG